MLGRRAVIFGLPLALAGCGAESVRAPQDSIARVAYRHPGPPVLTLYTCLNNDTLNGAHTGLLINASQRVIFDPAGSFRHPDVVENDDLLYGATPTVEAAYTGFQTMEGYHLVKQHIPVTAEVAEATFAAARSAGPVGKSYCTRATAKLLQSVPGLEGLRISWFPDNLMRQMAAIPGITSEFLYPNQDPYRPAAEAAYRAMLARA